MSPRPPTSNRTATLCPYQTLVRSMSTPASSAATCRRLRTTPMSKILCETDAGELPALVGVEEIAVGGTQMPARGGAAAAAQDELAAHELAILFADRARRGAEAGIGAIGAAGPFPHAAEHLLQVGVLVARGGLDRKSTRLNSSH